MFSLLEKKKVTFYNIMRCLFDQWLNKNASRISWWFSRILKK